MFLYVFFIFYTCTETFIIVGVYLKYSNELLSLVINLCFGWPLVDIMLIISSKSVISGLLRKLFIWHHLILDLCISVKQQMLLKRGS